MSAVTVKPEPERIFWRPRTLAKAMGVSPATVYAALYSGSLRGRNLNGRIWLIEPVDAEDWIERMSTENVERVTAA